MPSFIPEEHLRIVYRPELSESDRKQMSWQPPGHVEVPYLDLCGELDIADLLARHPIDIPSLGVEEDLNPYEPKFFYDLERFSFRHIRKNFSRAIELLEECYELKDAYQALDLRLIEERVEHRMSSELDRIFENEIQALQDEQVSISAAQSLVVQQNGSQTTLEPNSFASDARIRSATAKFRLDKSNRVRVRQERERLGSPYRLNEKRDRVKHKYLHRLNELVQLVEVLKHGMYEIFKLNPSYAVIDPSLFDAATNRYALRGGFSPERMTDEIEIGDFIRFSAMISDSDTTQISPLVEHIRDEVVEEFFLLISGSWGDIDSERVKTFRNKSISLVSDAGKEELSQLIDRAVEHAKKIHTLFIPSVDIEDDLRRYLWGISVFMEKRQLHSQETVTVLSLKQIVGGEEFAKLLKQNVIQFTVTDQNLGINIPSNRLALLRGVCAELELKQAKTARVLKYSFKRKNEHTTLNEYTHRAHAGKPVKFQIQTLNMIQSEPIEFYSGANFRGSLSKANASANPIFYGQTVLENIALPFSSWKVAFESDVPATAVDNVLFYLHIDLV